MTTLLSIFCGSFVSTPSYLTELFRFNSLVLTYLDDNTPESMSQVHDYLPPSALSEVIILFLTNRQTDRHTSRWSALFPEQELPRAAWERLTDITTAEVRDLPAPDCDGDQQRNIIFITITSHLTRSYSHCWSEKLMRNISLIDIVR